MVRKEKMQRHERGVVQAAIQFFETEICQMDIKELEDSNSAAYPAEYMLLMERTDALRKFVVRNPKYHNHGDYKIQGEVGKFGEGRGVKSKHCPTALLRCKEVLSECVSALEKCVSVFRQLSDQGRYPEMLLSKSPRPEDGGWRFALDAISKAAKELKEFEPKKGEK